MNQKIIIQKSTEKTVLNKTQKQFNQWINKIEKLNKYIKDKETELDNSVEFYSKEIIPLEKSKSKILEKYIIHLDKIITLKVKLSKKNKQDLENYINELIIQFLNLNETIENEELKHIYKKFNNQDYEEHVSEMENELYNEFGDFIKDKYGVDIDMIELKNMSEEDRFAKMTEYQNMYQQNFKNENTSKPRKKTKKQLEKEEREQIIEQEKKKSIGSIYKQLVKLLHPDLEQSEELKLEKEELMKKITIAYQEKDLHTLLRFEIEFIHKQQNQLENLAEEKLSIYVDILKEQVKELENELQNLTNHTKYNCISQFEDFFGGISFNEIKKEKREMEKDIKKLNKSYKILNSDSDKQIRDEIKKIIIELNEINPIQDSLSYLINNIKFN